MRHSTCRDDGVVTAPLTVAACQPPVSVGDVASDVAAHVEAVRRAEALRPLVSVCEATGATALVGAPVRTKDGSDHIATLRVDGAGASVAYAKFHLGEEERRRFAPGAQAVASAGASGPAYPTTAGHSGVHAADGTGLDEVDAEPGGPGRARSSYGDRLTPLARRSCGLPALQHRRSDGFPSDLGEPPPAGLRRPPPASADLRRPQPVWCTSANPWTGVGMSSKRALSCSAR